jgi:hypothetical protein
VGTFAAQLRFNGNTLTALRAAGMCRWYVGVVRCYDAAREVHTIDYAMGDTHDHALRFEAVQWLEPSSGGGSGGKASKEASQQATLSLGAVSSLHGVAAAQATVVAAAAAVAPEAHEALVPPPYPANGATTDLPTAPPDAACSITQQLEQQTPSGKHIAIARKHVAKRPQALEPSQAPAAKVRGCRFLGRSMGTTPRGSVFAKAFWSPLVAT